MSRVVVYEKALFCGRSHEFGPGRYDFDTLQLAVERIGSLRIPTGWKVSLFSNAGFQGAAGVLTANNARVDASSLIVEAPVGWASQSDAAPQGKLVIVAYSAAWKSGPSQAMIAINGVLTEKSEDGIHIVAMDDEGKVIGEHLAAHPWPSLEDLRTFLDGLPNGCFIVAAIRGEGVDYMGNAGRHAEFIPLWTALGSQRFAPLTVGESWAFVAKKGSGVLQEARSTSAVGVECIAVEGTPVVAPLSGQRKGRVPFFNGVDNYVSIPVNEPETGVTHECWFRTESPDGGILSAVSTDLGTNGDREIWLEGGNVKARLVGEEIASRELFLADGKWHHVAHVFGTAVGGQRLYVDGVLQASGTVSASTFTAQARMNLGYAPKGPQPYFAGRIAEVRLWRFAKSDAEVKRDLNRTFPGNAPDLLGYYRLSSVLGPVVKDSSTANKSGMFRGPTRPVFRRPTALEVAPILRETPPPTLFVKNRDVAVVVTAKETEIGIRVGTEAYGALRDQFVIVILNDEGVRIDGGNIFMPHGQQMLADLLDKQPPGRTIIMATHALGFELSNELQAALARLGSEKTASIGKGGWGIFARKGVGVIREEGARVGATKTGIEFKAYFDVRPSVLDTYARPIAYSEANYRGTAFVLNDTGANDLLIAAGKMSLPGTPKLGSIRIPRGWRVTSSHDGGTTTWTQDTAVIAISGTVDYRLVIERLSSAPDAPAVLVFDGDDDFITVELNEPETEVTHEFWFVTESPTCGMFCATVTELGPDQDREIWLEGGNICARLWNTEIIRSENMNLADGKWHHVAHVFGASIGGQRLYVDGKPVARGSRTRSALNGQKRLHIGYAGRTNRPFFSGRIAEVRVWSRVRDEIEISLGRLTPLTGQENKLHAYWKLDEVAGKVVNDSSSSQKHGFIKGATPPVYRPGFGRIAGPFPQSDGGPERGIEVQIRSAGLDAGDVATIQIGNTRPIHPGSTGVNVVVINPDDGTVRASAAFNVSTDSNASNAMKAFLEAQPSGSYIAAAVRNDAVGQISMAAREAWSLLGSTEMDNLKANQCWCILLEKGGNSFREEIGPRTGRAAIREFLVRKQPLPAAPTLPLPTGTLAFDIRTWGTDVTYNYASIKVNGVSMLNEDKHGINVIALDGTGALIASRSFAVTDSGAPAAMVAFLEGLSDGTIVAAAVRSNAAPLLTNEARHLWNRLGSQEIGAIAPNSGWAIVTVKGGRRIAERRGSGQLLASFLPYVVQYEGENLDVNIAGRKASFARTTNTIHSGVMQGDRLDVRSIVLQGGQANAQALQDMLTAIPLGSVAFLAVSHVEDIYLSKEVKDTLWAVGSRHIEEIAGAVDLLALIFVKGQGCLLEQRNDFPQRGGIPVPAFVGQAMRSPLRGTRDYYCALSMRSAGAFAGDHAFIAVNGKDLTPGYGYGSPGINAVAISATGEVLSIAVFDTGNRSSDCATMIDWIDSLDYGTIIGISVRGDAVRNLTEEGRARLSYLGSTRIQQLGERESYVMVAEKGAGCLWEESSLQSVYRRVEVPLYDERNDVHNVVFYDNPGYRGSRTEISVGKFNVFSAGSSAKSVRIPTQYDVALYEQENLGGVPLTVRSHLASLGAWNDRIRSIEVFDTTQIVEDIHNQPVPAQPGTPPAPFVIPPPIRLYVKSEGLDSGARSIVLRVNGVNQLQLSGTYPRGITLVVLSGEDGRKLNQQSFDTNQDTSSAASMALIDFLNTVPTGAIIVGMVCDDAQRNLHPKVPQAFKALGSHGLVQLGYRDSWAAVIRKGYGCFMEAVGPHRVEFDLPVLLGPQPVRYKDEASLDPAVNFAYEMPDWIQGGPPPVSETRPPGRIDVGIYSAGDDHGARAAIIINGTSRLDLDREGVNVVVLDKNTGQTIDRGSFDTSDHDSQNAPMIAFLDKQPNGALIAAAVKIDATEELSTEARTRWTSLGSEYFDRIGDNQGWAIVLEKGKGKVFEASGSQLWIELITGVNLQRENYENDLETPNPGPTLIPTPKPPEAPLPTTQPTPTGPSVTALAPPPSGSAAADALVSNLLAEGLAINLFGYEAKAPLQFITEVKLTPGDRSYVYEGKARVGAPFRYDVEPLTITIYPETGVYFIAWESPGSLVEFVHERIGAVPDALRTLLNAFVIPPLALVNTPTVIISTDKGDDPHFGGIAQGLNFYAPLVVEDWLPPLGMLGSAFNIDFDQFHPHLHVSSAPKGVEVEIECTISPNIGIIPGCPQLVKLKDLSASVTFGTGQTQQVGTTLGVGMRFDVNVFGETFICAGGLTIDGKNVSIWGAVDVEGGVWKNPFGIPGIEIHGLGFEAFPLPPWLAGRGGFYIGDQLLGGEFAIKVDPNALEKSMLMIKTKNAVDLHKIFKAVLPNDMVDATAFLGRLESPIEELEVYLVPNTTVIANQIYHRGMVLAGKIAIMKIFRSTFRAELNYTGLAMEGAIEPVRVRAFDKSIFEFTSVDGKSGPTLRIDVNAARREGRILGRVCFLEVFESEAELVLGDSGVDFVCGTQFGPLYSHARVRIDDDGFSLKTVVDFDVDIEIGDFDIVPDVRAELALAVRDGKPTQTAKFDVDAFGESWTFQAEVDYAITDIGDLIRLFLDRFVGELRRLFAVLLKNAILHAFKWVAEHVAYAARRVAELFQTFAARVQNVAKGLKEVFKDIDDVAEAVLDVFGDIGDDTLEDALEFAGYAADEIEDFFEDFWDWLEGLFS